jgi:hypothetical protein
MKKIPVIIALLMLGVVYAPAEPPYGGVSFGVFYSSLDPYGEWISIDAGLYAWRPANVEAGWRPYSYGRWLWTDDGWYWTSDEPWAWATYHYGRWYYDDYYGWLWIPGYDWAPAWVEWRYGGECVGWAPLGPYAVFSMSFGIFYRTSWVTPYHYWSFTDYRYMCNADLHRYIYRSDLNTRYISRSRGGGSVRYEGGRTVSRGPEREFVERRGNVRVEHTDVIPVAQRQPERYSRENDRGRVEVYRPSADRFTADNERPARVRDSDRAVGLEVQNLDVHSRAVERQEGRDIRRAEQYRQQRQPETGRREAEKTIVPRPQPGVESRNPEAWPDRRRVEQQRAVGQPRPSQVPARRVGPNSPSRREPERYTPPKQEPNSNREPRRESYQRPVDPPRREAYHRPAESVRPESFSRAPAPRPATPQRGEGRRER